MLWEELFDNPAEEVIQERKGAYGCPLRRLEIRWNRTFGHED
jgi:hypothetical protein